MTGTRMGMAESTVRLLTHDAAQLPRPSATCRHHHAFWQLDHCDGGCISSWTPQGTIRLHPGEGLLLPPGHSHAFRYPRGSRYVSWKFTWSGPGPAEAVHLAAQPGWRGIAAALAAGPTAAARPHLLAAAMRIAGAPPPATGFAAGLISLVDAHPERSWSVAALARCLDLSPGHASARFRAEQGIALKRWLDVRRAEAAGRMLAGSDLGIAHIADACGFSDQFAFSRFFRRVTGTSPSAFRARQERLSRP